MSPSAPTIHGAEADLDAYAVQAAHQLGEAVALLRGYLALLDQRPDRDPDLEATVRGLTAGTERAGRFVDDLLDLGATARAALPAVPVTLDDALTTAERRLARELHEGKVQVRAGGLPVVRGDRDLIVRLLSHLLRSAVAAGARTIEIDAQHEDGCVRVELRDDGSPASGDPFAPFARARGRGPLVGAGVGLTVCRRIVEHLGGTIALDQDADGVTVTVFALPAED
jgi:signal transduction histidine kinase